MKAPSHWLASRADSVYDNWRSGKKSKVTRRRFRRIVNRFAAWYETYTGTALNDALFDAVVEDVDLLLSADEIAEQIEDKANIPQPPSHYRPGMSLEEVEAPELVRRLAGTVNLSRQSSKMQVAAVKAWITMWRRKGEYEKAIFAAEILRAQGIEVIVKNRAGSP